MQARILCILSLLLAACSATTSSGGGAAAANAGSPCLAAATDQCGVSAGHSAHLHCQNGVWAEVEACPTGSLCTVKAGGSFECVATSAADAGGTQPGDASTPTDAADTTVVDTQAADGSPQADASAGTDAETADAWSPPDVWNPLDVGSDSTFGTDAWSPTDVWTPGDGYLSDASISDSWIGPGDGYQYDAGIPGDTGGGSCAGKCGQFVQTDACHCDAACLTYKDCCSDYSYLCSSPGDVSYGDANTWDAGYYPDVSVWDASSADASVSSIVPCASPCSNGQCDYTTGTCFVPCNGTCTGPGVACAIGADGSGPGTCVSFYATKSWGTDGASGSVQRISALSIAPKAVGCDLNGDGTVDNALSGAASLIGTSLQADVDSGKIALLFDPSTWSLNAMSFSFAILHGSSNTGYPSCAPGAADCHFLVDKTNYDLNACAAGYCTPLTQASGYTTGGQLYATTGSLTVPQDASSMNALFMGAPINGVTIKGAVTDATSWSTTTGGILCGYVTQADLNAAIDKLPVSTIAGFGGASAVKSLMPTLLKLDLDTNGDGVNDAFSVAYQFETKHAYLDAFKL